eukprot:CAMPEP_0177564978 /NCGR_PEP_ID=MMETSP0369-20130122/73902_1 /TAXON_ID=447022 ORGANISM="Scrippsiella hangoei-like, Strain SHHI-4" /NCGR_SAMPLE_ID=MMETSP0369 /ASSEMBLY_ACC=CAM_ASM_000364 /LENGTH=275 /DNA_ID=CAMNT_0019052299 /DNA_START=303 /DNA_END=1131 /DNA_ORIENTATION=-
MDGHGASATYIEHDNGRGGTFFPDTTVPRAILRKNGALQALPAAEETTKLNLDKRLNKLKSLRSTSHALAARSRCLSFLCLRSSFSCWILSFWRRLRSSGPHKWQKRHVKPFSQPFVKKKAHGLHVPITCSAEPMLGSSSEPGAGPSGGGGIPEASESRQMLGMYSGAVHVSERASKPTAAGSIGINCGGGALENSRASGIAAGQARASGTSASTRLSTARNPPAPSTTCTDASPAGGIGTALKESGGTKGACTMLWALGRTEFWYGGSNKLLQD